MSRYTGLSGSINPLDNRDIDSRYDKVEAVANNIEGVTAVADDLDVITVVANNINDVLAVVTAAEDINNLNVTVNMIGIADPATASLIGDQLTLNIPRGEKGDDGVPGITGKSAYQSWLDAGGVGTEAQFVQDLEGTKGDDGRSINHTYLERSINVATNAVHDLLDPGQVGYKDIYGIYADEARTIKLGEFAVMNSAEAYVPNPATLKTLYESNDDTNAFTDVDKSAVESLEQRDTANRDRANHTGTQLASTIVEEVDRRFVTDNDLTKLANSPSDTSSELDAKLDKAGGTITGTLTVNADIIQNGAAYETHAEKVYTTNDEIILRDGAIGALGAGEFAGLRAKKYDGVNDGVLVFGSDGLARVGDEGSTQALATREDAPIDTGMFTWDAASSRMVSSRNIDVDSITVSGAVDGRDISTDGATLDNVGTEADFDAAINF